MSPGSLASNPRVLKEAEALHGAGYGVTTVVCDYAETMRNIDDDLVRQVPWRVVRVPRSRSERYVGYAARSAARALNGAGLAVPLSVAASAYGGPAPALQRAARAVSADLYIAHYVVALPAAAAAAQKHGGMLGFDAEDFHAGEGVGGAAESLRMKMVERIEGTCLPLCRHLTAAAPLIGGAYASRYGVSPTTVLNVFPLAMAPDGPPTEAPGAREGIRVYWFSQTIGLDRGLQSFMRAMALARTPVTLDIRGSDPWGHGNTLMAMARDLKIADRLTLLPLAAPDRMAKLAASYDLGLSLETDATESRRLCLTNKIFTYLLAGVPVMMSDTPAQSALAVDLGAAATVVALADPQAIAASLDRLAPSPALRAAKAAAWRLGRERYNWDIEKDALIEAVASAFRRRSEAGAWPR